MCSLQPGIEEEVTAHVDSHCIGTPQGQQSGHPLPPPRCPCTDRQPQLTFGSVSNAAAGLFADRPPSYAYPIARAAQNVLTLRMAEELRATGIQVCAIHSGRMRTASGSPDAIDTPAEAAERLAEWIEAPLQDIHGNFFELDTGRRGW